jgi:hypothetical protein
MARERSLLKKKFFSLGSSDTAEGAVSTARWVIVEELLDQVDMS